VSNRLSRRTKLLYGAGDTGFSLTSTIVGTYLLIFLTDVVGIPAGLAGIPLLVGRSWDWINDPLVGHISDRTRTRWGRRRPFMLFGALPFGLAFAMLWYRPPWEDTVALVAYYAMAYVLFEAAATFVYMPYFALTPELTSDYDERTSLTSYRMFFSILGSLVAFTVPLAMIGTFEPQNAPQVTAMGRYLPWLRHCRCCSSFSARESARRTWRWNSPACSSRCGRRGRTVPSGIAWVSFCSPGSAWT